MRPASLAPPRPLWLSILFGFLEGFFGALIVLSPGIAAAPNLKAARSLAASVVVGAFVAGVKAARKILLDRRGRVT